MTVATAEFASYKICQEPTQLAWQPFLFNQSKQADLQGISNRYSFYLHHQTTATDVALVHFFIDNNHAKSPVRSSFGGIDCIDNLSKEVLHWFVAEVLYTLKKNKIHRYSVISPPTIYQPNCSNILQEVLLRNGFRIAYTEVNQHIFIQKGIFSEQIHLSEKRRLRKCQRAGFRFQKEQTPDLEEFYTLFQEARTRKGFPISTSTETIKRLFNDFPQEFSLFSVRENYQLLAACIGIGVNKNILYYFLPADAHSYLHYSPTVMLIAGMYEYCQQENIGLLDLGVSSVKGELNLGLAKFKAHLGAEYGQKMVFEKI